MAETRCLTAAMLKVGMRHEARLSFTREQVDRYCALSGDLNAIHSDVEAARLRFPGVNDVIVPGGLIQIGITGLFGTVLPGDGSLGLTFTPERFRKPVCPGETVGVVIEIVRLRGEMVEFDIALSDAAGARLGAAKSRVLAPDEAYRAWWEKHGV